MEEMPRARHEGGTKLVFWVSTPREEHRTGR